MAFTCRIVEIDIFHFENEIIACVFISSDERLSVSRFISIGFYRFQFKCKYYMCVCVYGLQSLYNSTDRTLFSFQSAFMKNASDKCTASLLQLTSPVACKRTNSRWKHSENCNYGKRTDLKPFNGWKAKRKKKRWM